MNNPPQRYGVIIGVSDYSKVAPNQDLRYTINDAERLYTVLKDKAGFAEGNLRLLCDRPGPRFQKVAIEPSRSNVISVVEDIAQAAKADDLLLVYFTGHGAELSGHPYLFTNDTRLNVIDKTAVDVSALNNQLQNSKARCVLRVFDACRFAIGEARLISQPMSRGFAEALLASAKGWSTLCSCSTGELAYEHPDLKQGVFSFYLCEGLAGQAAHEDGSVTWERLIDYVKISVGNFCKTQSWSQTPHSISDLSGSLVLVTVPKPEKAPERPAGDSIEKIKTDFKLMFDQQVAKTPAYVREFRVTSKEELSEVDKLVGVSVEKVFGSLNHAQMRVESGKTMQPLHQTAGNVWNQLIALIGNLQVGKEFTNEVVAYELKFTSSELVLPSSVLYLLVVRFQFFYWVCYQHQCLTNAAHTDWVPNPRGFYGHYTFKPAAALVAEKIQPVVEEIAQIAIQSISKWCDQSREFFDKRIQPLEKARPLIS